MIDREFKSLQEAVDSLSPADPIESLHSSGGSGCINKTQVIRLKSGKTFFLKENNDYLIEMFKAEAIGLQALLEKYPLRVPIPLAVGTDASSSFLIMENIVSSHSSDRFWVDFGKALAQMHKAGGSRQFGFISDNYIGSTRQDNGNSEKWTLFFAEKRLLFQVELARSKGLCDRYVSDGIEKICHRIDGLLPEPDNPSLLHGDLWSGNFIRGEDGEAVLIDPAVYYGHREADLAMTELFGGFNNSFYQAYNDEFSIDKDYRNRRDLYNLYHMLNHLNLFGSSYYGSVRSIISTYL